MKNFKKVFSKTVAPLYLADTYGFAIRKPLRKVYQTRGMQSIPQHCVNRSFGLRGYRTNDGYGAPYPDTPSRGVTRDRIKRGVAFQTTGMQSIPEHHVNWGIGFQTTGMRSIPEHHVNRGVGL